MAQLRRDHAMFLERDVVVLVIGPEDAPSFRRYFERNDLPFTGLPDPGHRVLELYGQEVRILRLGRMPAQAIVDRRGILRHVHYGESMADIPSNEEILGLIDAMEDS